MNQIIAPNNSALSTQSTTSSPTPALPHSTTPWSYMSYNCCSLAVQATGQNFAFKNMKIIRSASRDQYIIALQETKLKTQAIDLLKTQFSGFFTNNLAIILPGKPLQTFEIHKGERHLAVVFIDNVGSKQLILNLHGPHGNLETKKSFLKNIDNVMADITDRHCD